MTAVVSRHAAERYAERVDTTCDLRQASMLIEDALRDATANAKPRRWMRQAWAAPAGSRFVYSSRYPGLCLIVCNGVVTTVVTRDTCRRQRPTR